jgi:hypothetical protein
VRVDTVELTDRTNFTGLVHDALLGRVGGGLRSDGAPIDWVFRAHTELAGSVYADRLAQGVSTCLTAPEPGVRAQALVFYQARPDAAGAGRLLDLVAGDRALFRGVPDPYRPDTDLEWQLLSALAARIGAGDERAAALARAEVLVPGRAAPLIAELTDVAPDWVVAHAEQIVRGTPAAGATILIGLQRTDRDLCALARRIGPLCRGDVRFGPDIARFIEDAGLRRTILGAYRAG